MIDRVSCTVFWFHSRNFILVDLFTKKLSRLRLALHILCNSVRVIIVAYHQYADDLQLYTSISTSTSSNGLSVLSECANAVTRWHLENGLLLNPRIKRGQLYVRPKRDLVCILNSVVKFTNCYMLVTLLASKRNP